jgi:hypothetical protein
MNITSVKAGNFANGFSYFCPDCGRFFSVQVMDYENEADCCPSCGNGDLITSAAELLAHCAGYGEDPVNFYHAFPPGEPIPGSCTGATPDQVKWIVGCVLNDKQKNVPVTVTSLAASLGYPRRIVANVFEELHITEDGGAS